MSRTRKATIFGSMSMTVDSIESSDFLRSRGVQALAERTPPAQAAARLLATQGDLPAAAGNPTALSCGLASVECSWTADEIGRLLFVRHLVGRRRLRS